MSVRRARLAFALFLVVITGASRVIAQCQTKINIPITSASVDQHANGTLAWTAPAGTSPGASYDVMLLYAPDYCSLPGMYSTDPSAHRLLSTTATSATFALPPNEAAEVWVRLSSNTCAYSNAWLLDTYTTAPAAPTAPSVSVSGNNVTVSTYWYDPKISMIAVYRVSSDGVWSYIANLNACSAGVKSYVDQNVPNGRWSYVLGANNCYTVFVLGHTVRSSPTTVTVGPPVVPSVTSFSVSPQTIRPGQQATLSWTTANATSVVIDHGVGAQPPSGSAIVTPAATTTYTLTASAGGAAVTSTATVNVLSTPVIVVASWPAPMVQRSGSGGASTNYILTNAGGAASVITITQNGSFFTQTPATATLDPGASVRVTISGTAQPAGTYEGASLISGAGVATGLSIPVRLLSAAPPSGTVVAQPAANRVDVASPASSSPTGAVEFRNSGTSTLNGIVSSDAPWLKPQSGIVTIAAGATATVRFTIDRQLRPDATTLAGSAAATLSLTYLTGGAALTTGPLASEGIPSVSIVTVVDTVQLSSTNGTPPPLGSGEVALFVPGVGHVTGSVGTFVSDLSVLNTVPSRPASDVRFYYTSVSGVTKKVATVPTLGGAVVSVADVVQNSFGTVGEVGSLQVRSSRAAALNVTTTIFNASNRAGTYGTAIPTFRSDRAAGTGEKIFLAGLRKDATSHTNLFIQETSGVGATLRTDFLRPDSSTISSRTDVVGPFALLQLNDAVPAGCTSAVLTNVGSGTGRALAYATPVDEASGDNWSVVDWPRQYGYAPTAPVVIPVAGAVHGANSTFFQTDAAIFNIGATQGSGTLRYVPRTGSPIDRQITLGAYATSTLQNVVGSLFNITTDSVGYLVFTPATGSFAVTSRTYTTTAGRPATYGSGVPAMAISGALDGGDFLAIAGIDDTCPATTSAARGATFRTNFALVEVGGSGVTVRVTLRFSYLAGSMVQAIGSASKDYALTPNQFLMVNGITADIIGTPRQSMGDLRNVEADFQVVGGNGSIVLFTSSVDNGTGDSILRVE